MADPTSTVKMHEDDLKHDNDVNADDLALGVESGTLRRVPDRIPWVVLLILIVELGERFTYFGLSAPIQNYIKYVPKHHWHSYMLHICTV